MGHPLAHAGCLVEPGGPLEELADAIAGLIRFDIDHEVPAAAGPVTRAGEALVKGIGLGDRLALDGGGGEDPPLAVAGREGRAALQAEAAGDAVEELVALGDWFAAEDLGQHLVPAPAGARSGALR
jgi:hypothetical protein